MMTLEELHAHYKAVRERLNNPPPKETTVHIGSFMRLGPYPDPLDSPAPTVMPVQSVESPAETPARRILSEVADKHNMPVASFRSDSRKMPFINLRREACYRLSVELGFSLTQIGRLMGNRDHTTILNAIHMHKKSRGESYPPKKRGKETKTAVATADLQTQNDHC